ncbi:MAG: hypothetical protein ACI4RP_03165 [Acutalibacteraceae bacterium]
MFKKIASIAMAAAMAVGTAAFSASAAEVDDAVVAAEDTASEVSADQDSEATGAGKTISFDVNSANWGTVKAVYCHIYNYAGTDGKTYTSWQNKAEKCDYDASTGIATYDLQTGIDKGADGLATIDGSNKWVVMFSCNTGAETYTLLFNSSCFGDTVVADPNTMLENNVDSEKQSIKISYKKNASLTAPKCITSTGKIQGESFAEGVTNETLLGDYLATYAADDAKVNKDVVSKLSNELGVKPSSVFGYVKEKINKDDTNYGTPEVKKNAINNVEKVIKEVEGENVTLNESSNPSSSSSSNGSSSTGSSSTGSSSTGSTGSSSTGSSSTGSTGSGSVSSGQETTIFFVFGGVVVAAAGVMFLARKKRQF